MATAAPAPVPAPGALGKKALPELLPARMLNEFVYCPRLFFYEWVEGVFRGNTDTAEGAAVHSRVDTEPGALPPPSRLDEAGIRARSIELSSDRLGLIAKMDLVESIPGEEPTDPARARPVDYKRGRPMEHDGLPAAWPADRVQVAVQALILRDNGYNCDEAVIYYASTKQRARIPIDAPLVEETLAALAAARALAASGEIPLPLDDSPKCPRCSLVGICLPDETNALRDRELTILAPERSRQLDLFPRAPAEPQAVRQLVSSRDELRPLYLNSQGLRIGKSGTVITAKDKDTTVQEVRLGELSQINLLGNVQISTQAVQSFCAAEIPICYFSQGGWFYGITHGLSSRNVMLRRRQFRAADNEALALDLARTLVAGKIRNQRTLLLRNHLEPPTDALARLKYFAESALAADSQESLLGIEGSAARVYFQHFAGMLKQTDELEPGDAAPAMAFDFATRNRRPPRDPINALLSFAYSLLVKDLTVVCQALGFDAYWGFYHQPRFSRPALALDLMEPFRPLIADSVVLNAVNTRMVTPADFVQSAGAAALTPKGRKAFYHAYELRMDTLVTHPELDYRVSYRRMLEIQARFLARYLEGEIRAYPVFVTR
jgi:CRISPR-associated protein Cas1